MIALMLALALGVPNADNPSLFVEANAAQERGDFAHAASLYWQLIERGSDSGWLYYDLGNSRLRQGQIGLAIAAYRRAATRLPRESDVRANLAFARRQCRDALAPIEPAPLWPALFFWHYGLNMRELMVLSSVLNALLFLALGLRRARPRQEATRWLAGLCAALLALVAGSLGVHLLAPTRLAVVARQEIEVHSGMHHDTVVRFRLHEGSEARVLDAREGWLRLQLADGKQGWVAADDVIRVDA